jgi:hypothetical protein
MTEGKLEAGHAAPSLAYQPLIGNELKEQESIGWITVQHNTRYNLATEHIIQTATANSQRQDAALQTTPSDVLERGG